MAYDEPDLGTLKRKRRRRTDKPPITARLQLHDYLEGDSVLVSADIHRKLFPAPQSRPDGTFVAVTRKTPTAAHSSTLQSAQWIIVPCRLDPASETDTAPTNTIKVPNHARCRHSLTALLPSSSSQYRPPVPNTPVDVLLLDVVPIPLTTVFVSLDLDSVSKCRQSQQRYGGGVPSQNRESTRQKSKNHSSEAVSTSKEDAIALIRTSLSDCLLLHKDDMVPLALPRHPVTYAEARPATIIQCEPITQGILTPATRIVIVTHSPDTKIIEAAPPSTNGIHHTLRPKPSLYMHAPVTETDEEDTSEAFFTADDSRGASIPTISAQDDPQSTEDDSTDLDLSDDPDDIITLTSASASFSCGAMSVMSSATPRLLGSSHIQTPGSIHSHLTSTTIRTSSGQRSKTLKAQALIDRIPSELLFPKPLDHEDDDARVFVDTSVLARIGCFSGDWLAVEPTAEPPKAMGLESLAMSSFATDDAPNVANFRPLKVYALPESMTIRAPRYPIQSASARRSSVSSVLPITTGEPHIYMPPVLLANLKSPSHVRISRLTRTSDPEIMADKTSKVSPASGPPAAGEVNLALVNTQTSLQRSLQHTIFANLRDHFAHKTRLLKEGDLLAVSLDEELGVATADATGESVESSDLTPPHHANSSLASKGSTIIWCCVREIKPALAQGQHDDHLWNGLISVDTSITRLRTGSVDQLKVPSASRHPWENYYGTSKLPGPGSYQPLGIPKQSAVYVSQLRLRLRNLIAVATSKRAHNMGMPTLAILLSSSQAAAGKLYTVTRACRDLGVHCYSIDALDILAEAAGGTADTKSELTLKHRINLAMSCGPEHTCVLVKHVEYIKGNRMINALKEALEAVRVVIATTTEVEKMADSLRGIFTHEIELSAPDEAERQSILQTIVDHSGLSLAPSTSLSSVAVKTAALVAGDLVDVLHRAILARDARLEALAKSAGIPDMPTATVRDVLVAGGQAVSALASSDFDKAVDSARKNFADSIGAPKIPKVQWSDVGGLANVKDAVMETIQLPLSHPELFAEGLKKRSGILFYGPPGTGKTLLAKAIATEFSLNFFSVKGPELLNMYIGESEANVRRVFQRARDAKPCVVFFDELDSVAPKRGNQGDSGGVMDRIVSQLLAELDGMSGGDDASSGAGVFVIGATNRPDLLDQALLRPGRFDKMLYLGISDTHDKQTKILEALTRKFTLDPELSLSRVASSLPFTYTGADLYALCSDSMLKAITRSASAVDERVAALNAKVVPGKQPLTIAQFFDHHATAADVNVVVREEDFTAARRDLVPSVSVEELGHYQRVRMEFEGGKNSKPPNGLNPAAKEAPHGQMITSAAGNPSEADLVAYQARRIEEMMASGFADGSLPRNNHKDSRALSSNPLEYPKMRQPPLHDPRSPRTNGHAPSMGIVSPQGTPGAGVAGLDGLVSDQLDTSRPVRVVNDRGRSVRNDSRMRLKRESMNGEADDESGFDDRKPDQDDLIIRTGDLKLHGAREASDATNGLLSHKAGQKGKGKGKGKMRVEEGGFGDAALDEGLYD